MLTGCKTGDKLLLQPNRQTEITVLGFDAEKGIIEYANVGDELFVSGRVAMHNCIILSEDISNKVIPYGLTRPEISIRASALLPTFETADRYLYTANKKNYTSEFFCYGSNYCGISIDKNTKQKYWFGYRFDLPHIFEVPLTLTENNLVKFKSIPIENDAATAYKKIIFDGFYNNLFHFTLIEKVGASLEKKEFKFNPSGGLTTTVSFKGLLLKIHGVDNLGLKYEWLNPEDGIKDQKDSLGFDGA